MRSVAIQTESSESDRNESQHQRWKGLAHQIDADIQVFNQLNKTYSSLYRKTVNREGKLIAEIQQLQTALDAQSGLVATKANASTQIPAREYQTRNPYKLHKPVSDVATGTQNNIAGTPSIQRPRHK
jgi:hypothetical protein